MKLIRPNEKYKESYYNLVDSAIEHGDISEMGHAYQKNESFNEMMKRLKDREKGKKLIGSDVPSTLMWIIEDDKIVGTIDLRHILNKSYYERLGHVAYYIHPKYRNLGYATKALSLAIDWYKKMPINKILITCHSDNTFSKKVIISNGGILEKCIPDPKMPTKTIERYLIEISTKVYPRVAWLTTNRTCNSKCSWCYASNYNNKSVVMDYEIAKEYIKRFSKIGIRKVILIGGEPTIYKNIDKIIKLINNENITVSMASNGRKFSDFNFTRKLIDCGLKNVNISIKGMSEEEYIQNTNSKGFEEMIAGYKNLKSLGANVSLSYVLCGGGIEKIDKLYDVLNVNEMNNILFLLYKPDVLSNNKSVPKVDRLTRECEYVFEKFEKSKINYSIEMSLPLCSFKEEFINTLIDKKRINTCCHISKGNGIVFDTNFDILPCNHFLNIHMNTQKISPKEIVRFWNSPEVNKFRNCINKYPIEKCINCDKWEICGGGCLLRWIASNNNK